MRVGLPSRGKQEVRTVKDERRALERHKASARQAIAVGQLTECGDERSIAYWLDRYATAMELADQMAHPTVSEHPPRSKQRARSGA
jgi:hypothetical protein